MLALVGAEVDACVRTAWIVDVAARLPIVVHRMADAVEGVGAGRQRNGARTPAWRPMPCMHAMTAGG